MKNSRKILLTFASLSVGGAMMASAHMNDMEMTSTNLNDRFTQEAAMLGLTVDDIKNAWAEGKDIKTLAKEKGISEAALKVKMEAARDAEMKTKMQALVTAGTITQAQADKRLVTMKTKFANHKGGKGERGDRGGFMNMMGFGKTTSTTIQ